MRPVVTHGPNFPDLTTALFTPHVSPAALLGLQNNTLYQRLGREVTQGNLRTQWADGGQEGALRFVCAILCGVKNKNKAWVVVVSLLLRATFEHVFTPVLLVPSLSSDSDFLRTLSYS